MTRTIDEVKQIIEDADADSFYGLEYRSDSGEYLQVYNSAGWEEGMAGVMVDDQGQIWIDGDAVAESAQAQRVDALVNAGYSIELAQSQRMGYDDDAARSILG